MAMEPLVLFELDICVPTQKFNIEYTLVARGGFPFVPEFVLRLLKVSPMLPAEIARFFGFNVKELNVALTPFFHQGEIQHNPDGRISLSSKGMRLFDDGSDTPVIKTRQEYRKLFTFDLLTFSFLDTKVRSETSKRSVILSVGAEARSNSIKRAEEAFQRSLHDIYRSGNLCGPSIEAQTPELYKISDVKKERESFFKIEERYCIYPENLSFGFTTQKGISDKDIYISQRSCQLLNLIGRCTLDEIKNIADRLGDDITLNLLMGGGLDFLQAIQQAHSLSDTRNGQHSRFYGALQLSRNWDQVILLIKKYKEKAVKAKKSGLQTLSWVAPAAHDLWGKCSRHGQALSDFVMAETITIKEQAHQVFNVRILIPMNDSRDWHTRKKAKFDYAEASENLHGFIESASLSPLEIITLTDSFAVIAYHLVQPDIHPVPIPFGFITEDLTLVRKIEAFIEETMNEYTHYNELRYIGPLKEFTS